MVYTNPGLRRFAPAARGMYYFRPAAQLKPLMLLALELGVHREGLRVSEVSRRNFSPGIST